MDRRVALVTGFEPYGGESVNPSALVAEGLDGTEVASARVVGRVLPATIRDLRTRIDRLLAELAPAVVIGLGLCPGEPTVRLERVALNLADFEIPDNEGIRLEDAALERDEAPAVPARLPLRAVLRALLAAGIPARLSTSAGTFLCNAAMYALLRASDAARPGTPCGFVHLPYLPEQVAAVLARGDVGGAPGPRARGGLASMSLATMLEAVRVVLAVTLAEGAGPAGGARPSIPAPRAVGFRPPSEGPGGP